MANKITGVERIKNGIYFGSASSAVIETTKEKVEPDDVIDFSAKPYSRWGVDNRYPQDVVDQNMQDSTSAGALRFKRNAHYGAGIYFYFKEKSESGKPQKEVVVDLEDLPAEVQDFIFLNDIENFSQGLATDFEWWNMCHVGYMPNKLQTRIIGVKWHKAIHMRAELKNQKTGQIDHFYLSGDWHKTSEPPEDKIKKIRAFDKMNPFRSYGVYRHQLVSVDKEYYISPEWHAIMKWLGVVRKIPDWINANIDNSINIKYHIEIPEAYFLALYPREQYESDEKWKAELKTKEKELYDNIDRMLAGAKNASKTFYTKIAVDAEGKPLPGWKFNELGNNMQDEAWLKAYGTGAAAVCTGHGVPPSLAGLILSSGLGTGSASDVREQFNYYLQLNTVQPRQTTTEWWNFVSRFNRWQEEFRATFGREIRLGYRNIVLQSVDQNKSGYAQQNEPTPTTQEK